MFHGLQSALGLPISSKLVNPNQKKFQAALWSAFRELQGTYIPMAEKHGEADPVAWANEQINAMTNVELIDALSG
jgi:hypothetical protein